MDEQTTPKKVRRVGSIAFALVLIAAGVLLMVYQFVPQFDLLKILKFSPVILVALGIEMLVYSARPDVKVKFDWLAMLGTAFTLCIVGTAALLPLAISEWSPARNYAQNRIESQKADAMYSAMTADPALKAKLNSLNVEVHFFHEADGDYTLQSGDDCILYAALQGPYADAETFAADCMAVMQRAADDGLGFTCYHFNADEDTDDGISYYLDCVAAFPEGLTAAQVAQRVQAAGASILRRGAFKPRTSPYSFQGLRAEGLELLQEARKVTGQPIVTELMNNEHIPLFVDAKVDMIQIGARNMQNFELLKAVGKLNVPVLLKRGLSSTLEELVMSAEYIMAEGNPNVVLCERGIRTFETSMRNTLDISAVPMLKKMTHLPVVIDPSHAAGIAFMVPSLAKAAVAVGADGLMIEVHNDPMHALCDGAQSLRPEVYDDLAKKVRSVREVIAK